ncbi:YdcH family protein [Denitratisoma sp. agr-D3]
MTVEHHDLHHEFPEFKDAIHQLKTSNNHFARLFDEYHAATSEVEKLEGSGVPVGDDTFEALKKKRLKLKDELYNLLKDHKA